MQSAGFEPAISEIKQLQPTPFNSMTTVIDWGVFTSYQFFLNLKFLVQAGEININLLFHTSIEITQNVWTYKHNFSNKRVHNYQPERHFLNEANCV